MSRDAMWERVRAAWAVLSGRFPRDLAAGRERERPAPAEPEEQAICAPGFAEEALPWLDAVYRFALRLARGDADAAEDLAQETFLRAHRFWHTFQRGTNVKSWLFSICRNVHLREAGSARARRERLAAELGGLPKPPPAPPPLGTAAADPEQRFFARLIDERVIAAIDALPEEYHEVLVLSDLGDLRYAEIAEVLEIPVGTVKSRLFRARRQLQERLLDFAREAGYVGEAT